MPPPNSASHGTPALSPATIVPESQTQRSLNPYSPVLAETDDAHDENVNFLRSRALLYNQLLPSLSRHRRRRYQNSQSRPIEQGDRMDLVDPNNLHLSVEINRRIPIVRQQREDSIDMPNYGGRRSNSRSLYGWAPGSDDEETDVRSRDESDDEQIQPFLHAISDSSTSSTRPRRHETADGRARSNLADEPSTEARSRFRNLPISTMEALLHSARRQPRLMRTRTLENYLLDRYANRANEEVEETERSGGSSSARAYRYRPQTRGDSHRVLTHSDLLARATAHRQMHSGNTSGDSLLKDAITYLDRLRHSNSFEESISSAAATAFVALENFSWKDDDFILDTHSITPPAACSWLRPGMVFSGCQRAANARCAVLSQRASSPHAPSDPVIVNGNDSTRINVYTTTGQRYLANTRDENWPVKVTLHNINYSDMTLSGTMEAYNIPDKTSPTHDAHIITFLEGEIIDFNRHTLETKNFIADADIDSTYWRELEPFKDLSDSEMAKNLVSKKWISEDLAEGWILMRWKERCFITPTDSRQGLTISGFYYISLRRADGQIEGLYYDPGSSPYQQLSLKPETPKMIRPSYDFR